MALKPAGYSPALQETTRNHITSGPCPDSQGQDCRRECAGDSTDFRPQPGSHVPAGGNRAYRLGTVASPVHALLICILLFLSVCLGAPYGQAHERTVTVGIYQNEPKVFTSEDGRPSGIFVDVIEYIAEREGWELKYVTGTWAEGLDRLAGGEIDLMPDVAYTADREKVYSFHKIPVLSVWSQVYAPKGSKIQSILDLNGKRVAALERTIQLETFGRLTNNFGLKITLVPVADYKTEFGMIARGKVDAGVTNRFYGLMHAREFGLEDTPIMFDPAPFFFAARKGSSKQLLDAIDSQLSYLKQDPNSAYYASIKRWTSEEVRFRIPAWLQVFGIGAGVIVLASLGGSVILKRQVNSRTRELREVNRLMEQRIVERTAELAQAMEKAQSADRVKSAFLATMSHELRTPLNSIIGFTGILLQGLVGPLNDEQRKQLSMVKTSAGHLLSLISDVLDISKIEAGQLQLVRESFDLPASISKVAQIVRPLAEKKGLALDVDIAPGVGSLTSDMRRVEQVILNLLSNAVKFTEKGRVSLACSSDGGTYTVRITDTGIGIAGEDIDKIFMPFRQVDVGLDRRYEGTGLGLSICKRLVHLLGGDIRVESVWRQGSTFSFSLPADRGYVTEKAEEQPDSKEV